MIEAEGRWQRDIFGKECWDINYSSILTQLIQDAGRWCESYASDLFISWKYNIDSHLKDPNWKGGMFKFGFREMGVDHNDWIETNKDNPYYYRKIRTLTVKVNRDNNKITMELE